MSRKKGNAPRYAYAAFALLMVLVIALAGIEQTLRRDDTPAKPEFEFPEQPPEFPDPPEGTPDLPFDALFTHPSGYFAIMPPLGWKYQEASADDIFGAAWIDTSQQGVVHAFVKQFDDTVDKDQFLEFIEREYPSGFHKYEDYMVTSRDYDSTPAILEFEVVFDGLTYKAREWAGFDQNLVWVLRILVPENYPALLDYLGTHVLPSYEVAPEAGG